MSEGPESLASQSPEPEASRNDIRNHPHPGRGRRLIEWLLRSRALAEVDRRLASLSFERRERARRARVAYEGALRLLDPLDPIRHGDATAPALTLLRESFCWAIHALGARSPIALGLGEALATAPRPLLTRAAGDEVAFAALAERWLLAEPLALAEAPLEARVELCEQARGLVEGLLSALEHDERERERLLQQRWVRLCGAAAAALGLTLAVVFGYGKLRLPPDLAEGRPWRASSAYAGFDPVKHECDGNRTRILFHTNLEESPWLEIDLGASTSVGYVEVKNRGDLLQDRAVPLVIELSEDQRQYTEVARRTEAFDTWKASFPRVKARYVRVKAARKTFLHLEKVVVRRRG